LAGIVSVADEQVGSLAAVKDDFASPGAWDDIVEENDRCATRLVSTGCGEEASETMGQEGAQRH
jgi:hypothetical protein